MVVQPQSQTYTLEECRGDQGELILKSVDVSLRVKDIYRGVDLIA